MLSKMGAWLDADDRDMLSRALIIVVTGVTAILTTAATAGLAVRIFQAAAGG